MVESRADRGTLLRTPATWNALQKWNKESHTGCFVCERLGEAMERFHIEGLEGADWCIVTNLFPYDVVTDAHAMLVPMRHFGDRSEMTPDEARVLAQALKQIEELGYYDGYYENFSHAQSHRAHFHSQLFRWKRE